MLLSRGFFAVGSSSHELRINDGDHAWRIVYHVEPDAVVILEVFSKKTAATPQQTIEAHATRGLLESSSEKEVAR